MIVVLVTVTVKAVAMIVGSPRATSQRELEYWQKKLGAEEQSQGELSVALRN